MSRLAALALTVVVTIGCMYAAMRIAGPVTRGYNLGSLSYEVQPTLHGNAELLIPHTGLRLQAKVLDAPFVLRALLMSVDGRDHAWIFLQDNWERLNSLLPPNGIRRVCEAVVGLSTPESEQQVRAFFEAKKVNLGGKTLEQFLEQLRIVVRLREREGSALRIYLGGNPV